MLHNERINNNYNFLRLFAAFCIVLSHSFDLLNKSNIEPLNYLTNGKIQFSFIGLCIFFSCSGFLIAKSANTSASIKSYLFKRVLRIQPLLIVWCLLAVFVVGSLFTTLSTSDYFNNIYTWRYFKTIMPLFGVQFELPQVFVNNPIDAGVNGSLWTLIVEERLYVLMAFLFLFKKNRSTFFIVAVAILDVVYILNLVCYKGQKIPYLDTSPTYYALCFLNAGLLYFLKINFSKKISWLLIGSLFVSAASIYFTTFYFLQVMFIPVVVTGLAQLKCVCNKMGKYGDYTYGVYIFSYPIQQILIALKCTQNSYILFCYTILIILPIAFVSWHFFEKKLMTLKNKVA